MDKILLKDIIIEQSHFLKQEEVGTPRELLDEVLPHLKTPSVVIITGMRRTGKSTFLKQILNHYHPKDIYYLSFEDERLLKFSVHDFNLLYETFIECFGKKKIFFLDEIQNIPQWEIFVRRMQDMGFKFFITGSNASLLSKELGTKLTGRVSTLELYPFSFREFLLFHNYQFDPKKLFDTAERGLLKKYFHEYLVYGGMPEYLKYHNLSFLKQNYEDILYRDIVSRYEIKEIKALRELALYLLSNVSHSIFFNKIKNMLELGSVNTVKNYVYYLENSYLIFILNRFSFSLKEQTLSYKKIYAIDNGLVESVAYQFSKNHGKYLENLVFLELKRRKKECYYYKTQNNLEVDFLTRKGRNVHELIQVSDNIDNLKTRDRELNALLTAMNETHLDQSLLLTSDHKETIKMENKIIQVMPIYQWLLEDENQ